MKQSRSRSSEQEGIYHRALEAYAVMGRTWETKVKKATPDFRTSRGARITGKSLLVISASCSTKWLILRRMLDTASQTLCVLPANARALTIARECSFLFFHTLNLMGVPLTRRI